MKKQFEQFRPKEFTGSGDNFLFPLISELSKVISLQESQYYYDTLKFDKTKIS